MSRVYITLVLVIIVSCVFFMTCDKPTEPKTGSINVQSDPSGADIELDTSINATTPHTFEEISPGFHTLSITLDLYHTYYDTVEVKKGRTTLINEVLEPTSNTGTLIIESTPSNATISINGSHPIRRTPYTYNNLSVGTKIIHLHLGGYDEWYDTVNVTLYDTTMVSAELIQLPVGTLIVRSNPTGADIWLNGEMTNFRTIHTFSYIDTGAYCVILTKQGYEKWEDTVVVEIGQTTTVDTDLIPHPATLTIESEPEGANIYLEGDDTGLITPCTFNNLDHGMYEILLAHPDCFVWQEQYYLPPGEVDTVSAMLDLLPVYKIVYTDDTDIYSFDYADSSSILLATDYDSWVSHYISYPGNLVCSPNGQYIIYNSLTSPVVIIDEFGTIVASLTGSRSVDFNWSNNSRYVVYGHYTNGIYRYDVQTNDLVRIYATSGFCYDHNPAYSPNNAYIAFIHTQWSTSSWLYRMNSGGGGVCRISNWFTTGSDEDIDLIWASDTRVVYKISSGIYMFDLSQYDGSSYLDPICLASASVSGLRISTDRQYFGYFHTGHVLFGRTENWSPSLLAQFETLYEMKWTPDNNIVCRTNDGVYLVTKNGNSYHLVTLSDTRGSISAAP